MDAKVQRGKKPHAVVFALDTYNGLQTARTLSKRGVPVIGIASDPKNPLCRTKVCEQIIIADTGTNDLINALEALGPKLDQKAVIYPCNNVEVMLISQNREKLAEWYHIILSEPEVDATLMLKDKLYAYCEKNGFPIPRTFYLHSRADAERAAKELVYPCMIKPSIRSTEWIQNSPTKGFKAFSADELLALYDKCEKWTRDLLVQEWIEGPDSNLYTCYTYFGADHEPLVTFVTRKLRQFPPEMGDGCLGEECRNDLVLQETVRLFKGVHLRGLGYLEMKCDARTGKYYIVEPNIGRPTSKSALAEAGGVELVYTMYCDALGWELPANRQQKYGSAKWVFFRRDFPSAFYYWRRGELSLADWYRSLRGVKMDALFSWSDQAPFWYDLLNSIRKYLSPRERKKSNFQDPFPKKAATKL